MAESEIVKVDFTIDLKTITKSDGAEASRSKLSSLFAKMDKQYIRQNAERKDIMRTYRDIPISLNRLYRDDSYVNKRHGADLSVLIDSQITSKKRRRQVTLVRDSFSTDEEQVFLSLHQVFGSLLNEFPERTQEEIDAMSNAIQTKSAKDSDKTKKRTIYDIIDIFIKVSGDMQSLREYLQGKQTVIWTYLDDLALSMPENSNEFKQLFSRKGRDEIEKRRWFLLRTSSATSSYPQTGGLASCSASVLDKLDVQSVTEKSALQVDKSAHTSQAGGTGSPRRRDLDLQSAKGSINEAKGAAKEDAAMEDQTDKKDAKDNKGDAEMASEDKKDAKDDEKK